MFSDVDTAYANVESNIILLRPYKEKYLAQAVRVRDTVTYSYQRGGASLLDFLNAESDYRSRSGKLFDSDRRLSDRRGAIESGGGPGGYPVSGLSIMGDAKNRIWTMWG